MKKVFCIGEVLIDFVAEKQGSDLSKATLFTKKAGGAPANVAVTIAKLGGNSAFIGRVGEDPFGNFLVKVLADNGVDTSMTQRSKTFTTLAFVSLAENGERDFVFGRGADQELEYDPSLKSLFYNNIIHMGAATALLGGPLEKSYGRYLFDGITQEAFISFDPNFRNDLWKGDEATFIKKCMPYIEKSHLCKFSWEEAQLLSGKQVLTEACEVLHEVGTELITITLGAEGTYVSTPKFQRTIPSISVHPIDTTGAGDAFIGCLLQQLSSVPNTFEVLEKETQLCKMIAYANTAGAITTTGYGAIESLPSKEQVFSS